MPQSGPTPQSEREYLIEIYNMVGHMRSDVERTAQTVADHTVRLESLEDTANRASGAFLLVKFALAAIAPIGALAGWLGSRVT